MHHFYRNLIHKSTNYEKKNIFSLLMNISVEGYLILIIVVGLMSFQFSSLLRLHANVVREQTESKLMIWEEKRGRKRSREQKDFRSLNQYSS